MTSNYIVKHLQLILAFISSKLIFPYKVYKSYTELGGSQALSFVCEIGGNFNYLVFPLSGRCGGLMVGVNEGVVSKETVLDST